MHGHGNGHAISEKFFLRASVVLAKYRSRHKKKGKLTNRFYQNARKKLIRAPACAPAPTRASVLADLRIGVFSSRSPRVE